MADEPDTYASERERRLRAESLLRHYMRELDLNLIMVSLKAQTDLLLIRRASDEHFSKVAREMRTVGHRFVDVDRRDACEFCGVAWNGLLEYERCDKRGAA